MENFEGSSNLKNLNYNGKSSLPPKSPFPSVPASFPDLASGSAPGPKSIQMHKDNINHQRTSSESVVIDDQPSWLADLLDEPETPIRKGGHRRSSSDSFAYRDTNVASNNNFAAWGDDYTFRNLMGISSWGNQEQIFLREPGHSSFPGENNISRQQRNHAWASSANYVAQPVSNSSGDKPFSQNIGLSGRDTDVPRTTNNGKQDARESGMIDKRPSDGRESSALKSPATEMDAKRAKQQFAQRSRVRKLQYIAELERTVQALQAEGSEVSAVLEFTNQQNLILSMENKALKQRLDSLVQEHLIKHMEQEVLEREIGRLRNIHQQQSYLHQQPQPQQHPSSSHRRNSSRDLDSQFANLSLNKEVNPNKAALGQSSPM